MLYLSHYVAATWTSVAIGVSTDLATLGKSSLDILAVLLQLQIARAVIFWELVAENCASLTH